MYMPNPSPSQTLTREAATELTIKAATVFQPRAPISTREFFAGRWDQLTSVTDAVAQTGLHIVLFGERGVGKTSLANIVRPLLFVMERNQTPRLFVKVNINTDDEFSDAWKRAFDEIYWDEDKPMIGFEAAKATQRVTLREKFGISNAPTIDEVRRTLGVLKRSVFVFDEFDRGGMSVKKTFTDLIKALSDYAVDSTIIIVGVSDTIDDLVRDHASIVRSIIQIQLPRMNEAELKDILAKAAEALGIEFDEQASSLIVGMSQGLPHYTHLIGLHATREALNRLSVRIEKQDVESSFERAVHQAEQSIRNKYLKAIHSAHKDALYPQILLACASASATSKDALGYFHPANVLGPLMRILQRRNVTIATFQKHINEFCEETRGAVLQREGTVRSYKYRFSDPLLPPYIFMSSGQGISELLNSAT